MLPLFVARKKKVTATVGSDDATKAFDGSALRSSTERCGVPIAPGRVVARRYSTAPGCGLMRTRSSATPFGPSLAESRITA